MAARGRKPKSVEERAAHGNAGKRSLVPMVPAPATGDMLCPNSVQQNPRALAYWTMYLENTAPGHLRPVDAPLLADLCMALAWADEAEEKVAATGLLVKPKNSPVPIQNPYLPIVNRQSERARKLAADLGLTVAERNRVGGGRGGGGNGSDPAANFLD